MTKKTASETKKKVTSSRSKKEEISDEKAHVRELISTLRSQGKTASAKQHPPEHKKSISPRVKPHVDDVQEVKNEKSTPSIEPHLSVSDDSKKVAQPDLDVPVVPQQTAQSNWGTVLPEEVAEMRNADTLKRNIAAQSARAETKKEMTNAKNSVATKVVAEFLSPARYELDVPSGLFVSREAGESVQSGDVLADISSQAGTEVVAYTGKLSVSEGDAIRSGQVLAKKGFLRKQLTKSPVEGVVKIISPDSVTIDVTQKSIGSLAPREALYARSSARIAAVTTDSFVLEFPAVSIPVLTLKGDSAQGVLRFIPHEACLDKKNLPTVIEHSIVVTDRLTPDSYPIISSLGARVILTQLMDYTLFRDIVPLSVTIAVISAFGTEPVHIERSFAEYLHKKEGTYCYFDALYYRLLIPDEKKPPFLR